MKINLTELSKTSAHALRHSPKLYLLELEENGWVNIKSLIEALANNNDKWQALQISDIELMVNSCQKQRFEIIDGKIRARYGHSISNKINYQQSRPIGSLYHGTSPEAWVAIQNQGLLPMRRQYVHLSPTIETAKIVALRRTSSPVIIKINTQSAQKNGIKFYMINDVWLSERIDSKYLEKL